MSDEAKREVRRWKALEVRTEPLQVYWGGVKQDGFSDTEARYLFVLALTGQAPFERLAFAFGKGTEPSLFAVYAGKIRKKFQHRNIDVDVSNIPGWGYELKLIGDAAEYDQFMSYEFSQRLLRMLLFMNGGAVTVSVGLLQSSDGAIRVRQDGENFTAVLEGSSLRFREDPRSPVEPPPPASAEGPGS